MKFTFQPGVRPIRGYTIRRGIHRGAFGEVYYAVSDGGKEVALKLLQENSDIELRGVQQCLNLKHPNLVAIFDVRQDDDGDIWVVMEYIAGANLEDSLAANPQGLGVRDAMEWVQGIADGVAALHERGIIHRDLKPGNLFRENGIVKVGDVGLSKSLGSGRRDQHTQSVGTAHYMAPEVMRGEYGVGVDIYALAVVAFELLTGRVPFDGETTAEILMKHLTATPDVSPLPQPLRPVIARALAKTPQERPATIQDFARELTTAAALVVPAIPNELPVPPPLPKASPNPLPFAPQEAHGVREPMQDRPTLAWRRPVGESKWWWPAIGTFLAGFLLLMMIGTSSASSGPRLATSFRVTWFAMLLPLAAIGVGVWASREATQRSRPVRPTPTPQTLGFPEALVGIVVVVMMLLAIFMARSGGAPIGVLILLLMTAVMAAWYWGRARTFGPYAASSPLSDAHQPPLAAITVPAVKKSATVRVFLADVTWRWFVGGIASVGLTLVVCLFAQTVLARPHWMTTPRLVHTIAVVWLCVNTLQFLVAWGQYQRELISWWTMLMTGLLVGGAVGGLDDVLDIDYRPTDHSVSSAAHRSGVRRLGGLSLVDEQHPDSPTPLAYSLLFGSLFSLQSWPKLLAAQRTHRMSVGSALGTAALCWATTLLLPFPTWSAVAWGIAITLAAQAGAPWDARHSRHVARTSF